MPGAKNIAALLFLGALALPVVLFSVLRVQMRYVRHEMEERLEKEQLVTIAVHKDSIVWAKKDKEIVVSDRMFDIKSSVPSGDSIIFSGLFDEVETEIKAKLRKLADHQNNDNSAKLVKKLTSYTLNRPAEEIILTLIVTRNDDRRFYITGSSLFANPFVQLAFPPPRKNNSLTI